MTSNLSVSIFQIDNSCQLKKFEKWFTALYLHVTVCFRSSNSCHTACFSITSIFLLLMTPNLFVINFQIGNSCQLREFEKMVYCFLFACNSLLSFENSCHTACFSITSNITFDDIKPLCNHVPNRQWLSVEGIRKENNQLIK